MMRGDQDDDRTRSHATIAADSLVSHYRITEKIAAGGMGEIYLARDTSLDRMVALKFILSHQAFVPDTKARFLREARSAAALSHPNVVAIHEVGEHRGRLFIVMEYVKGKTLQAAINHRRPTIAEACDITIQVARGLKAAHQRNIVHRDIKPSNVVVDTDGRARILDFGLAFIVGAERLTRSRSTPGTIGYMSPEQVKAGEIDHRSDLFSLGVVLYEMITGVAAFRGENEAATLYAILDGQPEPLETFRPDAPVGLQNIVDRLLAKKPEDRYQTAADLLFELKALRDSIVSSEDARTIAARTFSPALRSSWWPLLAVLLLAVIVITVAVLEFDELWPFGNRDGPLPRDRLAVMYFDNIADPDDSLRLGEITTNLLISDLSQSRYVSVVSSQRLFDILNNIGEDAGTEMTDDIAFQVARKAGSRWMLTGQILNVDPDILMTVHLVEVATGQIVTSERVEGRPGEDVFSVVDRLTVEIKQDLALPEEALAENDPMVADLTTPSADAYRHYIAGMDLMYAYRPVEAERRFRDAIALDSTFAGAWYGLALCQRETPRRREAIARAVQYIDGANRRDQHYILAQQAWLDGDFETTELELAAIIDEYPQEKEAFYHLGILYSMQRKNQAAIAMLNEVVNIDPGHKDAFNNLAYAYSREGDYEQAIRAVDRYIELAPDEPNPCDTRGDLLCRQGNLPEARAAYLNALEIDPDYITSTRKLGHVHLWAGDYAAAESLYQIVAAHPNVYIRSDGRNHLANVPLYRGRFRQALRVLTAGINADQLELGMTEISVFKMYRRAVIYGEYLGEPDSALAECEQARRLLKSVDPADNYLHILTAYQRFLNAKGDFTNATAPPHDATDHPIDWSRSPLGATYWFVSGLAEFAAGRYDSAYTRFANANQLSPSFRSQVMSALCMLDSGWPDEAVAQLEQALTRFDRDRALYGGTAVLAHFWLARAYDAQDRTVEASHQYQVFLDKWKDADPGLPAIDSAGLRLSGLKNYR